jgi:hypothetical protein
VQVRDQLQTFAIAAPATLAQQVTPAGAGPNYDAVVTGIALLVALVGRPVRRWLRRRSSGRRPIPTAGPLHGR